jgi:preprotein translocase subunit YajC
VRKLLINFLVKLAVLLTALNYKQQQRRRRRRQQQQQQQQQNLTAKALQVPPFVDAFAHR